MTPRLSVPLSALALLAACSPNADSAGNEASPAADSGAQATVSVTRLDCGTIEVADLNLFSQAGAYPDQQKMLVDSCYVIRHGDDVLLWDTGLPAGLKGQTRTEGPFTLGLSATIPDQLARMGLKPEDVDMVGVSHYHFDHTGQLADFPGARLLIGAGDWEALATATPDSGIETAPYKPWLDGKGRADRVMGDKDLFGDGSVVLLSMPGHTPGHMSLKLRTDDGRTVMLTGDLAHFQENYDNNGVPTFNTDKDESVKSLERFKAMAKDMGATVVIQHEAADVGKLPGVPGTP